MIDLTESTFRNALANAEGISIVQFSAPWCGPCKFLGPVLSELESEGVITYYKVNADTETGLAGDFKIMSVPTMLIYKNDNLVKTLVGVKTKKSLVAELDSLA